MNCVLIGNPLCGVSQTLIVTSNNNVTPFVTVQNWHFLGMEEQVIHVDTSVHWNEKSLCIYRCRQMLYYM